MNTLRSARFIFMTISSYYRRLMVMPLLLVVLIFSFASHAPATLSAPFILVILLFFSSILSFYPFYASDKVPQLFAVLPQSRAAFVRGVYLVYSFLASASLVLAFVGLIVLRADGVDTSGLDLLYGVILMILVLIASVELPIVFRTGYVKTQMIFNVIFVLLFLIPMVATRTVPSTSLRQWLPHHSGQLHGAIILPVSILIAGVFVAVSCRVSLRLYRKKDL